MFFSRVTGRALDPVPLGHPFSKNVKMFFPYNNKKTKGKFQEIHNSQGDDIGKASYSSSSSSSTARAASAAAGTTEVLKNDMAVVVREVSEESIKEEEEEEDFSCDAYNGSRLLSIT